VRPRTIPVPECECEQLPLIPVEQVPSWIYPVKSAPMLDTNPACPSFTLQSSAPNLRNSFFFTPGWRNVARLFCANKVWMLVCEYWDTAWVV
ncbi:hypothetical protein PENTCL1PPCAC_28413, partial [Pristionchus entomophagus]